MNRGHRGLATLVASVVLIVGACGTSNPVATPTPAPAATQLPSATDTTPSATPAAPVGVTETPAPAPMATPAPAPTATPAPTPTPVSKPAPAPASPSGWTKPRRVGKVAGCNAISAGIDVASRYHIAAECGGTIYYLVSNADGTWATTVFAHPADRQDFDPQIAFRGNVVYVAYSRIAVDGGCGGYRGANVGVYFRTRAQPSGSWSKPVRIGPPGDHVQSFRIDRDMIHATVVHGEGGAPYYETLAGGSFHRYRIPDAIGATSLRIGSDGRARIVYETSGGIRKAVFTGSPGAVFSTSRIPGSTGADRDPILVLDANDQSHIVWTRITEGACGEIPVGTYYATNAGGAWKVQRITPSAGQTSLQFDDRTGRVHVLVNRDSSLGYYTAGSTGKWTRTRLVATWTLSPLVRLDPATGTLLVVYIRPSRSGSGTIYALTRAYA